MGERAGRLLPSSWKGRIALVVGIGLVVGLVLGARYYFGDVATNLAEDYRAEASPAVRRETKAMDRIYDSFDTYIAENSIPHGELKDADDVAELKRLLLPIVADASDSLKDARRQIKATRKQLKREQAKVADTPEGPPLLDDDQPLAATRKAARKAKAYDRACERYIDRYARFIHYAREINDLDREGLQARSDLAPSASIEAATDYFTEELGEAEDLRSRYLKLDPPPDADRLHELSVQISTAEVNYLEDAKTAFETLDQGLFTSATDEYLAAVRRFRDGYDLAYYRFLTKSQIQSSSRKLSREADELERQFSRLGKGGEDSSREHHRPAPPSPPKQGGGDEGAGDGRST